MLPQLDPAGDTMYDPLLGTVIAGRYRVLARIGEGGMGAVYRAEHTFMKKVVALKVLHPEMGRMDDIAKRFQREAQSASRLAHEGIIQVTDFGRAESGALYLVMEYASGESLASVLDGGRLPLQRAVALMRLVLDALAHAHAQGVVHRDLKPENIVVLKPSDGRKAEAIKLLDFGIAKILDVQAGGAALTQAGMIFGTPSYMSPEQASGATCDVDARADLYACGVMLYQMLAGRLPFIEADPVRLLMMQVTAPAPDVAEVAPEARILPALAAVVMRSLAKKPDGRFPSATAFLDAIEAAVAAPAAESLTRWAHSRLPELRASAARLWSSLPARLSELRASAARLWSSLPARHRRRLPLAGAGVLAAILLGFSIFGGSDDAATNPAPVEPELRPVLDAIEQNLARGQLVEARAGLLQQLSKQPGSARVHYLLGQLEFVEQRPHEGLTHYREALRLDRGYRGDAALLRNVRVALEDRRVGRTALDLLVTDLGPAGCATVVDLASRDRRPDYRRVARATVKRLGCREKVDYVQSYALDLAQSGTCDEKKEAVSRLRDTDDRRAIEPLRKAARNRSSNPVQAALQETFGVRNASCAKKEIAEAIEELED